jgi:hypothetical protein
MKKTRGRKSRVRVPLRTATSYLKDSDRPCEFLKVLFSQCAPLRILIWNPGRSTLESYVPIKFMGES